MRRRTLVMAGALGLLNACAPGGVSTPVPTRSDADRQAALARETEVAGKIAATAEARGATATAQALPTVTATATPPRPTPTPRLPTPTPPPAAARLYDFQMAVYQGHASLGGEQVRLSGAFTYDLPVVVNFWAPLCGPCRTEMPAFQRVSDEFVGRVFFLGVDVSPYWSGFGGRQDALALINEAGLRYPLTYATESPLQRYQLLSLPSTYFFAPDGTALDRAVGAIPEDDLRAATAALAANPYQSVGGRVRAYGRNTGGSG